MFRLLTFTLFLATTAQLSAITVKDAYPRHMDEEQFKTVTEFLTGEKRDLPRVVVRTQADERTGQYFILTLDRPVRDLPAGTELVLEVLKSDARDPEVFPLVLPAQTSRTRQLYIGVTGQDWPSASLQPLAWRVQLRQGETVLSEWKSFLWELP